MKMDIELTFVTLPGIFNTIRWNYHLYLPLKSFQQIALNKFYRTERKAIRI